MLKMKYTPSFILALLPCFQIQAQINFNDAAIKTQNYIYSKTCHISQKSAIVDYIETMQYFDGLGRPVQTVSYKSSPASKDMIRPVEYDNYGREVIQYLPYTASVANGTYRPG